MVSILSIESATKVCSISLHQNGRLVGLSELNDDNVHSKVMMIMIQNLLQTASLSPKDLNAVAISAGPGSYTGLRIGVSVAKGLAFANDIPLIGLDTLKALAYQIVGLIDRKSTIVSMIDARRMEVYASSFLGDGTLLESPKPVILDEFSYRTMLDNGLVYFIGDGATKFKNIINHRNAIFLGIENSSKSLGLLAYEKFIVKDFEDLAYFEPNYLKEFKVVQSKKNPFLS
ncbi:tRNA (adenosine(37)-N6)-threonylcarbamoyltransferase complex dimerization subunit type 1 TsaB [Belliella kenyensis]|uniref:tRNA (Adenosine(37)-N6)-threonylcarbamoyltransferase complex dimerization subunit type 1 TsaB n=1 Tax=Belliella kenyensis TaxID=1472724 RepID=A0ABV8EKG4_9BACT|nr:tRNA (adenosine(37)-N6)-threonylcarbamoyltransferase complex dimerization subunit type 1 TsaB [Belliella kenyensis]MCH7403055.1 tRNA (adenosine(37)-N6)-threonylcarbamoyltransferase complex dimerization subunit type 1 TsaB [Belliella kenyensis]MDN3602224.1 tRNA (adenosine(37)-N6)-threonylcarbamoyltransferase complex dimerization subunit type 1 TsaB [Belliella kenyensis]